MNTAHLHVVHCEHVRGVPLSCADVRRSSLCVSLTHCVVLPPQVLLWDHRAAAGGAAGRFNVPAPAGGANMVTCLDAAGHMLLCGGTNKHVTQWDLRCARWSIDDFWKPYLTCSVRFACFSLWGSPNDSDREHSCPGRGRLHGAQSTVDTPEPRVFRSIVHWRLKCRSLNQGGVTASVRAPGVDDFTVLTTP